MLLVRTRIVSTQNPAFRWWKFPFSKRTYVKFSESRLARNVTLEDHPYRVPRRSPKRVSRQEAFERLSLDSSSKIEELDKEFGIFTKDVTKVLDLGFVPGNWSEFAKYRLCQVHGLSEEKFPKVCHILGFDILFGTPPAGVSSMQGNIFSKTSHNLIKTHFQDVTLRKSMEPFQREEFQRSYYVKELGEAQIEKKLQDITDETEQLDLNRKASKEVQDYKPDVVLSDLSAPFLQLKGFFNNTHTKPYLRMGANSELRKVMVGDPKISIDTAEAALVLVCDVLKRGGTFVLRLSNVDLKDKEVDLLEIRLGKVFEKVHRWNCQLFPRSYNLAQKEVFFVCLAKVQDVVDKQQVFAK